MNKNAQEIQAELDAVREEFKTYVYSASHDLSAPVRAMVEFSKILMQEHAKDLNDEGKEYLEVIVENGQILQRMMDGLLDYSRLNTTPKCFVSVNTQSILEDTKLALDDCIKQSGARIEASELPTITADADQLGKLFYYILSNAIKFRNKNTHPEIKIHAENDNDFWQFTISDNGIGISPQYCETVFSLFKTLHAAGEFSGAGMGLTLARKIVESHGGKIWIESTLGDETKVHFTLPCATRS